MVKLEELEDWEALEKSGKAINNVSGEIVNPKHAIEQALATVMILALAFATT